MAQSYYSQVRKEIMARIIEFIRANPDIEVDKICGIFAVKTGNKGSTIRSMVIDLKNSGRISIEEDRARYVE